jgi:hypothetical protein
MPLDHGTPIASMRSALEGLSLGRGFVHTSLVDADMADCCLAGIWLLHDFLSESHTISQGIATTSGCYWHGIMHRREGDYNNAKYWLNRAGRHPVAGEMSKLTKSSGQPWDPCRFVDVCERAVRRGVASELAELQELQQREWWLLFDYCYRAAIRIPAMQATPAIR